MAINYLSPRNSGTQFNKHDRRRDRLYGTAHLSRGAGPLRVSEERIKSKDKKRKMTTKKMRARVRGTLKAL